MEELSMSNFILDCINGDTLVDEIDDCIDRWHDSNKEYELFVLDESYLPLIVTSHKEGKEVNIH